MALVRRLSESFKRIQEVIERQCELAEMEGVEIIRIKSFEKCPINPMHGPQSMQPKFIYGFEVFNPRAKGKSSRGKLTCYPGIDKHAYGYIPNTDRNLTVLAQLLEQGDYFADDKYYYDLVVEKAKELGLAVERNVKTWTFGADEARKAQETERKRLQRERLLKQVEDKRLDDEIAELEKELYGAVEPEPVVEPEPIVEPEPTVEPEPVPEPEPVVEQEPVAEEPDKAPVKRQLSGKKITRAPKEK